MKAMLNHTYYTNPGKLTAEFSVKKRGYCRIPQIVVDVSLVPTIVIFCSVSDARLYSAQIQTHNVAMVLHAKGLFTLIERE